MSTSFLTRSVAPGGALSVLTLIACASQARNCDDSCLHAVAERYLSALQTHDTRKLGLAAKFKYTENGETLPLTDGLWTSVLSTGAAREYFTDPGSGNALVVTTVNQGGTSAILATRLRVVVGKVTEVEAIVARKDGHPLFAPELFVDDPLLGTPVKSGHDSARYGLIAIADTYFDGLEQHSSAGILATAECDRFENGVKTTHRGATSGGCAQSADAISYIKSAKNRRCFLVDEATGVVACNVVFDIPGGDPLPTSTTTGGGASPVTSLRPARMLLLTEIFKIEDGRIQRIQAIMHNLPHGNGSGWD